MKNKFKKTLLKLPNIGIIQNRIVNRPIPFNTPENIVKFGRAGSIPVIQKIRIGEKSRDLGGVGALVKKTLFPDNPPFTFNVSFSCAHRSNRNYTNPESHWFNVFLGYYELVTSVQEWNRPFGYNPDLGTINMDEILKIGKADWNYFSNYMYGVPKNAIDQIKDTQKNPSISIQKVLIGDRYWHRVSVNNFTVVSAYHSFWKSFFAHNNSIYSPIVRRVFGKPFRKFANEQPDLPDYFPVDLKVVLYMSWERMIDPFYRGEDVYKTIMVGCTMNEHYSQKSSGEASYNEQFLNAQTDSVERFLKTTFRDVGFRN